jgi:serine/threonine-protein kinase HipA
MCQALGISPALKYESDGGPGIAQIMELLLGSSNGLTDRKTFMTQVFLFWVMGAIDGHAKNFSISLRPGGAFQLTPAYDVVSVYPLVGKGQYEQKKVSMAMSLKGKRRHYLWEEMFHRHWISTAKRCNFPEDEMAQIIERVLAELDRVIAQVEGELPKQFPDDVATPIFEGMKRARERIRE